MAVAVRYQVDPEQVEQPLARMRRVFEMVEDVSLDEDEIGQALAELRAARDEIDELAAQIEAATP